MYRKHALFRVYLLPRIPLEWRNEWCYGFSFHRPSIVCLNAESNWQKWRHQSSEKVAFRELCPHKGLLVWKVFMSRRSHDKNVVHHRCLQPQSDPNFLEMSRLLSLIPGDSGLFRIMCHTRCVYRIPIWNFDMSYSMYRKYRGNFPFKICLYYHVCLYTS